MPTNWTNQKKWTRFQKVQPTKTEFKKTDQFEHTDHYKQNRICKKQQQNPTKVQDQMASQSELTKHAKKNLD